MASNNITEDSDRVQLMQHIPMARLPSADRPIYRVFPSHDDEGSPYIRMQDVYVALQYPGDILIFKDEYQQSPVLIQGVIDGNPGWIPYYPNRTLYFRRSDQEFEPNSPTLLSPPHPARSRLGSTRIRSSRRGSPPLLSPRVGSPSLSPPRPGSYGVGPSRKKSPRLSPMRSSAGGAISFRIASPPCSSGNSSPYAISSSTGRSSSARRSAGSRKRQQPSQHAEQPQPDEAHSDPAASPTVAGSHDPAASPTVAGSHDPATSSSVSGSGCGSPGTSAPVARQAQRQSQCNDGLADMISLAEEQLNDSRTREEQSIRTVNQFLDESAYLSQYNYDLKRQIHALQQDNQNLLQDNQVLYQNNQALQQDSRSLQQVNQNLAQENQVLHQEIQTIHQNYGDLQNLNHLREQEICDLRCQNAHFHHREGTFVCIICSQRQQGGSGAVSPSSSSPSRSTNPRGPSSLRRIAPAPPQNPQALVCPEEANWRYIRGPSAPKQGGQVTLHQGEAAGSSSGAPYIDSSILDTSPTLPPPATEGFDEDPTTTAAATLLQVAQSQSQVLNDQGRHAAHGSPSSQSPSAVAAAMVADFVERDIIDPYNSCTLDYRVHDWVHGVHESNPSNEGSSTPDTEDEEVGQDEDKEFEEDDDYEVKEEEYEECEIEEGEVKDGQ
ncbi:hypothetical protein BG015_003368 [Linnemannia schmuckeri]|uniref:Uncharacterized protein n=1 Tax=Linnemannia schmuckeri TaxID=64567 RepID=A0A9P5V4L0_9FUNG|nr:hypothetical protein BG015_003368 [Linnemannia schmuckeri]